MLNLQNIELYCIDGDFTKKDIFTKIISYINKTFNFKQIKYFSPENPNIDNTNFIKINKINSSEDYSEFIIADLAQYLESDFILTAHSDGFPINPHMWTDEYLNYDFIGAPWPWKIGNDELNMGKSFNGGFSLRSSKFVKLQTRIPKIHQRWHEDAVVTDIHRPWFLSNGCRYSTYELAKQFSLELDLPDSKNDINNVFGFHYQKENVGKRNHNNLEVDLILKEIEKMKT
jgi:hypothetical protein